MKEHLFPFNTKLLYEVRAIYIYVECNEANYTRVLQVYRGIPLHFQGYIIFCLHGVRTGTFSLFFKYMYIFNIYYFAHICRITIHKVEGNVIAC